jgi:hypothetical protein
MKKYILPVAAAVLVLALAVTYFAWRVDAVSGVVVEGGRPVPGATVRVKATGFQTLTDADGRFELSGFPAAAKVQVTAWADGYYIAGTAALPWRRDLTITLARYPSTDSPDYEFLAPLVERSAVKDFFQRTALAVAGKISVKDAFFPLAGKMELGCIDCHGEAMYGQWANGAHARGTANIRLMTMYNGTDVAGRQSPPTVYGFSRDYGQFPLKPDPARPYYGPGFKLDFPDQAGNCADCHAPAAALHDPAGTDLNLVTGLDALGSHCDFCHKIADARLDAATGLPPENLPGVLSLDLRRPAAGQQVFFGPYDDVDAGTDSLAPAQQASRACAPCHNASFWGTPVYQSYAEWLASPYPAEGVTCQSCHMAPSGANNFAPGRGGVQRDPATIFTHAFPGVADINLLRHTARLEMTAARGGDGVNVEISVTNENGGHHIPTDHPMRNIILIVEARDGAGDLLPLVSGPVVPAWGGTGDAADDYAGRPGRGYAKVLEELWTEISPSAAYWRQTVIREDTRLPARATDVSSYVFQSPPAGGAVTVKTRLIFRRAFKELAGQKGWQDPDILMNEISLIVP